MIRIIAVPLLVWTVLWLAACGRETPHERHARCGEGIPVVDEAAAKAKDAADRAKQSAPAQPQPAQQPTAGPFGTPEQRQVVREYMRRLMDETRIVPDTAAKKGGPRGSPGSFAKLSGEQVEEFISAIIYGAARYMPKSLTDEQRWALVCAEISIESAFQVATSGVNPGDGRYVSVGPLQLTISNTPGVPGMWEDIFRQYAPGDGLIHHDGSPWNPKDTSVDALRTSIFDGVVAALWCITEQGRRGCPEWMGGPDGPCAKDMQTAFLGWVIGCPATKTPGGDLAGQRDMYLASISTDLKMLGFDPGLIQTVF